MLVLDPLSYHVNGGVHQLVKVDCVLLLVMINTHQEAHFLTIGLWLVGARAFQVFLKFPLQLLIFFLFRPELIVKLDVFSLLLC
jgi:hypothetical protein